MIFLALIAGCKTAEPEPLGTFATYNAGLATGFVPGSVEREPLVADAIAAIDADVLCLQEVWTPEQVASVEAAAGSAFSERVFFDADQVSDPEPACPDDQLDALTTCAETNCTDVCSDELVSCVQTNCGLQLVTTLDDPCLECAFANIGGSVDDIIDACEAQTTKYAYGGSFGVGLLSKVPLENVEMRTFDSTTNRRGAVKATAKLPGGDVDVFCTHLTAAFDGIPYPKETGSWSGEQTLQVEALREWAAESTGPTVLLGDFNVGPSGDGLTAEEPENYDLLVDGYANPYLDQSGECTYCGDNPLLALSGDDNDSELIDHVLFKGFPAVTYAVERIVDETVNHGTCGVDIEGAYSDHYGVRVSVETAPE